MIANTMSLAEIVELVTKLETSIPAASVHHDAAPDSCIPPDCKIAIDPVITRAGCLAK